MKIYHKKGATNYKEKKLIAEITEALNKRGETPDFEVATTYEELKSLHDKICGNFDDYEEVKDDSDETEIEAQHKQFRQGLKESVKPTDTTAPFSDPFNDAEPIVRDYVLNDEFASEEDKAEPKRTTFDEPTSFEESFELPSEEDEKSNAKSQPKEKKDKPKQQENINPRFDDMSSSKKRRSTKKLAQMIVEGACILAEKGCIWWTTKDITEDKLVEYELNDSMDLQILLTLDEGQQITIREWFRMKVSQANTLFKISAEDKEDLIDSLFEVLMEKGIAPTPTQQLMINAVKTFVLDMGLKAFAFRTEIKSVLNQLVMMKENEKSPQPSKMNVVRDEYIDDTEINNPIMDDSVPLPESLQLTNSIEEISETEL